MSPSMPDRTISVCAAIAAALWSLTALMLILGVAIALATRHEAAAASLMTLSVLLGCAASVASVKVMLRRHYEDMRNAFDLGRDSGRLESVPVQRVH